mmetsp:Transcript_26870/g.45798  ORF Transcript_26870/g.45798 Transcript_26870/m.45798 type:complete len:158 (+) Transcript_26870:377-850(+)|eukprot:CAMPEP_0183771930 /NCGR_PEP_ID=MMETSP0739-20130205/34308_1 /TAXON_ID=385413 /ORGANISM="Thalassiosira miniscula, Strain CCMP1093" /LENGTH=157 /DNA_ID=CAMNT_0026012497 /DNA_START=318 /DNA_END=791 /DNA_ORIENTATION=+
MAPLFQEKSISCESSASSIDCTIFKVETFSRESSTSSIDCSQSQSHDPFSNFASPADAKPHHVESLCKSEDPFLYYSNDDVRIKTLKMEEVSDTLTRTDNATRKTRISFEVHPSMIFNDMFDELYGDGNDDMDTYIDNLIADGSGSVSDLLAQLLQI